jgi:hypothetical protein
LVYSLPASLIDLLVAHVLPRRKRENLRTLVTERKILCRYVNIWKLVKIWSPQAQAGILACRAIGAKYIQSLNEQNSNDRQRYTQLSILWTKIGFQRNILAFIKSKVNTSNLKKGQLPPRSVQYS